MKKKKTFTLEELDHLRLYHQQVFSNRNHSLRITTKEILFYLKCAQEAEEELKNCTDKEQIRLLTDEIEFCYDIADGTARDVERDLARDVRLSYSNYPMYKAALEKLKEAIEKLGYIPGEHITNHFN